MAAGATLVRGVRPRPASWRRGRWPWQTGRWSSAIIILPSREAFVQQREQLRANWYRDGQPGAAREGQALLQGIVGCGVCGHALHVQHWAARDRRAPASATAPTAMVPSGSARPSPRGLTPRSRHSWTPSRPCAWSSRGGCWSARSRRAARRRQHALQIEQAQYETRLAQRRYEAVDPDQRLVAAELERAGRRPWRGWRSRHAVAQADRETAVALTDEERVALDTLAQDLPAIWHAETTTGRSASSSSDSPSRPWTSMA